MVESDDEFAELCSKLLKRVKKNNSNPLESQNAPKPSTAVRGRLKRTKPSGTKKQKKDEGSREADIIPGPDGDKLDDHREEKNLAVQNHLSNDLSQNDGNKLDCQEGDTVPLDQKSVKDLVLERMQQFKREAPSQMKLESTETNNVHVVSSKECQSVQSDGDLALALQMDSKEKPASLEDEGLFFCQLCQKDLTAMSSTLREQHVNRCLDQIEGIGGNSVIPTVPSCPLCGKPFSTEKSRASHLKRCAVKLDVPAQTLLQAVQRQAAEAGSEVPPRVVNGKRKGRPKQKEPSKKRRMGQNGAEMEDLLVAVALSRSMQEDKNAQNTAGGQPAPEIPSREKKSRRKQKDKPTPLLLAQAPEVTMEKLQKRLSMLLTEEAVENNVMMLPPSHFWTMEEEDRKCWKLHGGKRCVLWDISNMMEKGNTLSYYTTELSPAITPWKSPLKKLHSSQTHANSTILHHGKPKSQTADDKDPVSCEDKNLLSDSQKALLDLAELAGDGMTLTQWNGGAGNFNEHTGRESPGSITSSGFIPAQEEKVTNEGGPSDNKIPLLVLSADFMEMVNNPHLSDAQLQTDCGGVLNAHMFVLYARCPLLVEAIHSEGFWVDESGMGRARRLLLNDVSSEAALCFLRFLYSATTDIPGHCLPHVCELARRFGVKSLIDTCELLVSGTHNAEGERSTEEEGDDGGERAETFQELLKSMWMDEGEDVCEDLQADRDTDEKLVDGGVGEGELEEIYEFALTQRKILAEQDSEDESEQEFGLGGESEDRSPKSRNGNLEERKGMDLTTTTSLYLSPIPKDKECSPRKSSAFLPSNSLEYSVTSAQLKMQPLSSSSFSPAQSPSMMSVPGASPTKVITSHNSSSTESPIPVISLLSPNRDEDPEADLFAPHTPPPIDDSYDRMFSQTCGIYEETSDIGESTSHINPASPQDQQPVLTSSPTAVPSAILPVLGSSPNIQPITHSFLDRPLYSNEHKSLLSSFKNSHSSTPTQNSKNSSSKASCQDADIILILSSDEEMESSDPASAMTSSRQFDIPAMCKAIKESPVSFTRKRKSSEGFSHLEMSSSSEMSWLVPATPLSQTASSKVSVLQTSCIPQMSHASQSPPNLQKTSQAVQSPEILQKTSPKDNSSPSSQEMSHVVQSPPNSQKTPQSSPTTRSFDLDVSCQSFVSQTQACSVSLTLVSPKSPRTPQSLRPSIQEKLETGSEAQSSACSKTPSTPLVSVASSTVFEVVDSEDEAPVGEPLANISNSSYQFHYDEPPIPMEDDLWCDLHETPRQLYRSPIPRTPLHLNETPTKSSNCKTNSPSQIKSPTPASIEGSPQTAVLQTSCQSYLNSKLWEDEEPELPAVLPLTQRLMKVPEVQTVLRTPVSIVRKRELAPKVPITPLPNYSDMDTPILKKELNKFGVRALPKKKMVLKLKEIFRYTHQVTSSDSEDDVPSSQPRPSQINSAAPALKRPSHDKQRPQNTAKGSGSSLVRGKGTSVCTAQETDTGDDQPLTASQESTASSVAASDTSSLSQSSNTNEFEMAFADEDDDEPVAASQAASKDALTAEAVRRFIEARPELHKRILLYQPLDLATLHAEIKQNGIKIAAGKLLDFLDSQCITFTTAAARKEKKSRRRVKAGKKRY